MENSSSNATIESTIQNESDSSSGCGCSNITISVNPTTGGQFDLAVTKNDTIENLKKLISKKLKVPKERICLLHRERQLREGTIQENQLVDGSRLTLLPSVETGLLAQRPEQSVMQALESLNDCQVNDFLSGKAPLNLTMRLGDHMMLIQLQLSTVTPGSSSSQSCPSAGGSQSSSASSSKQRGSTSPGKPLGKPSHIYTTTPVEDPLASLSSIVESTTPSSIPSAVSSLTPAVSLSSPTPAPTLIPAAASLSAGRSVDLMTASSTNPLSTTATTTPSNPATSAATSTPNVSTPVAATSAPLTNPPPATASLLDGCKCDATTAARPTLDTRALAEASRNLTQTLKQLSSEVLTSKSDPIEVRDEATNTKRRQGAIIESMHHHGKGVYSGTFSGTLNPALQDRFGRPKRDISTIIHILNDLLCATPQYRTCRGAAAAASSSTTSTSSSSNSTTGNTSDKTTANNQQQTVPMSNGEAEANSYVTTAESLDNQATRGKMERLRLIMEERREKRRAARSSPYPRTNGIGQTNASSLLHAVAAGAAASGGNAAISRAQQQLEQLEQQQQWSAKSESQCATAQAQTANTTASATATAAATTADQPNLPMDTDLCSQPEVSPEPVVA